MPSPKHDRTNTTHPPTFAPPPPEVVDAAWLLRALGITLVVALLCGYAALCLLFSVAQWQLVLHPTRQPASPPPSSATLVHFGVDATGKPQLTGWWFPATPSSKYRQITLLYLRPGTGALAEDTAALAALQTAGANILAFDYRGFGSSAPGHPSQQRMSEDAATAWRYLTSDRHLAPQAIIPYGVGLGASLATHLAADHHEIPALILDDPTGDALDQALRSPHGSLLPVRLLFNQRFELGHTLAALATPKLILSRSISETPFSRSAGLPRMTVALPASLPPTALTDTLTRFLDQYLPPTIVEPVLLPVPPPLTSVEPLHTPIHSIHPIPTGNR